jgi:hypothetical protein
MGSVSASRFHGSLDCHGRGEHRRKDVQRRCRLAAGCAAIRTIRCIDMRLVSTVGGATSTRKRRLCLWFELSQAREIRSAQYRGEAPYRNLLRR